MNLVIEHIVIGRNRIKSSQSLSYKDPSQQKEIVREADSSYLYPKRNVKATTLFIAPFDATSHIGVPMYHTHQYEEWKFALNQLEKKPMMKNEKSHL